MGFPQAGVDSVVEGWLYTEDGPMWVMGTVVQGQGNIILSPLGTPAATVGSLCEVTGASSVVTTGSGTVFHNGISAAIERSLVVSGNFRGSITRAGQAQVITRR